MSNDIAKKIGVFAHYPCHDGLFAASLFSLAYPSLVFPANYDKESIRNMEEELALHNFDWVVFLDYTPPVATLELLDCRVTIIDHHVTGKNIMDGYSNSEVEFIYSDQKCGALLTCEYLINSIKNGNTEIMSNFLGTHNYLLHLAGLINIRDVWIQPPEVTEDEKLTSDAFVNFCIGVSKGKELKEAAKLLNCRLLDGEIDLEASKELILERRSRAFHYTQYAVFVSGKHFDLKENVALVNVPHDICGEVAQFIYDNEELNCPYVMCFYLKDFLNISFRSRKGFNIRTVAEKFGGGGHDCASGARVTDKKDILEFLSLLFKEH